MSDRPLDLEPWEPWTPAEISARLRGIHARWYVLAGWALDLFVGRQLRDHADAEIGVREEDYPQVASALEGNELVVVGDGRAWPVTEETLAAHRQTWVREPGGPWRLDVIRERWDRDDWLFRRDERIRLPARDAVSETSDGIPFLRPELVLLFKAKSVRPKDQADLEAVLPRLTADQRTWLADALRLIHPGHPWLAALAADS